MKTVRTALTSALTLVATAIAVLVAAPATAMAMGSTYTIDMDIPLESYALNKQHQMFIDLNETGVDGTLAEGTALIVGHVTARHLLSDGSYHREAGLPHAMVHSIHLQVFKDEDEALFDGLIELSPDGAFSQEVAVEGGDVITVAATMSDIIEEVRPMERRTFLGTASEESFVVLEQRASVTLHLLGSIWRSHNGYEWKTHEAEITCTAEPELGSWGQAECTGLEPFYYSTNDGYDLASRIRVAVAGERLNDTVAQGYLVVGFGVGSGLWYNLNRTHAREDIAWQSVTDEAGTAVSFDSGRTFTVTRTHRYRHSFFFGSRTEFRENGREFRFTVMADSELIVPF